MTNLLETFESQTRILNAGFGVHVVYLDYRKAFDTVPHSRLLTKLQGCGVNGQMLRWIQDFLVGRSMRVMVNGNSSPLVDVVSGAVSGAQFADVQWNSGVQTAAVFNLSLIHI